MTLLEFSATILTPLSIYLVVGLFFAEVTRAQTPNGDMIFQRKPYAYAAIILFWLLLVPLALIVVVQQRLRRG